MISRALTVMAGMIAGAAVMLAAGPAVTLPETVHDFGAFSEDLGTVTCRVPVVNSGDVPLIITTVRATCGCTVPEYSKDPVAPGDTAYINVRYNAVGRPGKFNKKLYVYTNAEPERYTIDVEGTVIATSNTLKSRFPVDAGQLKLRTSVVAFGEVVKGKVKTVFFDAYNRSNDTIKPYWTNLPPGVSADWSPKRVAPGEEISFTFFIDTKEVPDYGVNSGVATLVADSLDGVGTEVSVIAIVDEDFSTLTDEQRRNAPVVKTDPVKYDLGKVVADKAAVAEFTISNNGKSPLIIRRLQTVDNAITSLDLPQKRIKPGGKTVLKVTIDPKQCRGGIINSKISIITNDPYSPTNTVRVVGIVQ